MNRILIVEDETAISRLIEMSLSRAGYDCTVANDGLTAANCIENSGFDLALLDIMLPGLDGYALLDYLRPMGTPVIFITAKSSLKDRVQGLRLGADDYLVKPFALAELLARLRVLIRRRSDQVSDIITVGDLQVDCAARTAARGGQGIPLSAKEFAVLEYLARNAGVVLSRERISHGVWNYDYEGGSNVVDVYIRYLRKKIDEGRDRKLIHTVRGVGYVLREEP